MPITTLPAVPTIDDPQNFATEADAFLGALPTFVTEANALAAQVQNNATTASTAATSATTAASTASAAVTTAVNSATSAANSASSASTSATNAAASASTATTQATNAATSATNASTSAASASAIVTSSASNRPSIRPSLLLDFSNTKVLDPRITFTRNSISSYFDYDGLLKYAPAGKPCFAYDPITGESLGLQIFASRTNLLTYSEQFDNAAWLKTASSISQNAVVAPDGTLTGDKLVEGATNAGHWVGQVFSTTSGSTYAASIYAKAGERSIIQASVSLSHLSTGGYANFDLANGSVSASSGVTASITAIGKGWYRCAIVFIADGTASANVDWFLQSSSTATRGVAYTGDGTSGLYIWGAQIEAGGFPTSYIPSSETFTGRASTGTYFGSDGLIRTAASGEARWNYNPLNLKLTPKLLLEEQRTNLLTYSEQFDNAAWTKVRASVVANATTAPDGTITADKLIATAISGDHFLLQNKPGNRNITYSATVFAKAAEFSKLNMYILTTGAPANRVAAKFDLYAGTVYEPRNEGDASGVTASIVNVGGGWYCCSVSGIPSTSNAGTATEFLVPIINNSNREFSWTGDGTSGIYIWGAQLEEGAFPTSYIKTEASQVTRVADTSTSAQATRAADVATMTGSNFSSWYRQGEGSMYSEYNKTYNGSPENDSCWYFQNSDFTSRFGPVVISGSKTIYFEIVVPSGFTGQIGHNNTLDSVKHSVAFKVNDVASTANGSTISTDTSTPIPVVDRVYIGSRAGGAQLNGCIKRIAYYPKRLTNTELQTLST